MKTAMPFVLICAGVTGMAAASDLSIAYNHAGLTRIEVTGKHQLRVEWHTGRLPFDEADASPMRQSLEGYDRHSSEIWLTESELDEFVLWVQEHGVLDFKSTCSESLQETYGSAFHSTLTVTVDGREHSVAWTGDSIVPTTLIDAVKDLTSMSQQIRKSREGE